MVQPLLAIRSSTRDWTTGLGKYHFAGARKRSASVRTRKKITLTRTNIWKGRMYRIRRPSTYSTVNWPGRENRLRMVRKNLLSTLNTLATNCWVETRPLLSAHRPNVGVLRIDDNTSQPGLPGRMHTGPPAESSPFPEGNHLPCRTSGAPYCLYDMDSADKLLVFYDGHCALASSGSSSWSSGTGMTGFALRPCNPLAQRNGISS